VRGARTSSRTTYEWRPVSYLVGIDIGGTFTDCVIVDENGGVIVAKSPSTPSDFSEGFFNALELGAGRLGLELEDFLQQTSAIGHGTTVATNAMVQRRGAKVGLLTTAGHRDVLRMMRAYGRVAGLPPGELMHYSAASKPAPIVPYELIEEINERVDSKGDVVVELDEDGAREAIRRLLESNVEAIAISLLWGFKNPVHERRLADLVREADGSVFVTTSHELVPRWGEYERTAAVAINSYVGPVTRDYLDAIERRARDRGYPRSINLMQSSGGVVPSARAAEAPVRLLESGPAGGVIGSRFLSARMGIGDVIATDMGGTTFDVGLVIRGEPIRTSTTVVDQYEFFVPTIDIRSIGAGGGSIAWHDPNSNTIKVGPQSAGSDPGPVAFGRGGTQPTVTDADIVLGYLNPEFFLGGAMPLRGDLAEESLAQLGASVGRSAIETAAGVVQIVDFQMADQIRKVTIERGYDPRDLTVFAYGGAGPVHGGAYSRELGARRMIVPLASTASVWSALGIGSSDLMHVYEQSEILSAPWDPDKVAATFAELEERAVAELRELGFDADQTVLQRIADVRYSLQVHVVETPVGGGALDDTAMQRLVDDFERRYEELYGEGAGFAGAGLDIVTLRLRAIGRTLDPTIPEAPVDAVHAPGGDARKPTRAVWWHEVGEMVETDIYDGALLRPGHVMEGPCVLEMPETTVVVRPGQRSQIDGFGNVVVDL
jgi:N-methylhydantoinase A